ncbi:MAG: glycosyltransferase family 4 protein, partial [Patescibacteria group bacterium]
PNGVDLEIFRPKEKIENKNEKIILTVSRLVKKNGIDDLIKAGQYLHFPFKIIIIGTGPDEEKLKKLVKEKGLEDKIIFKGQVKYDELPEYYASTDVFVRPSLSEGLGNVFLEAMACGLPVIGTEVGGIPDFLKDKETGLFCRTNNPQDIADKIKEILEDNNLRNYLIKNGLELVKEKYSWDNITSQIETIYLKLINEK